MLCALIGLDEDATALTTTFFEVHLRESTVGFELLGILQWLTHFQDAMKSRTGTHARASIQLSLADKEDVASVRRCGYYLQGLLRGTFALVDLPNVLLASFTLHLERLQKLVDTPDFAFASHVAPAAATTPEVTQAPVYTRSEGFEFDMTCLQDAAIGKDGTCLKICPTQHSQEGLLKESLLEALKDQTTLDAGQAVALVENLNRGLAFTQGPPGTGKTFLGVSLARVILASQSKRDPKPILVCCQTNHALDDFLCDLLKKDITKIVRLGSGSKEEWIKPYLLREANSKIKQTTIERGELMAARTQVDHLIRDGVGWAESLSRDTLGWDIIKDHIRVHHPDIFSHFASLERVEGGMTKLRRVVRYSGFAYEHWLAGGDIHDVKALLDVLDTLLGDCDLPIHAGGLDSDSRDRLYASVMRNIEEASTSAGGGRIWSLPESARHNLVHQWIQELNPWKPCDAFAEVHRRHQAAVLRKRVAIQKVNERCLAEQQIIGLTTTACARYWELLNRLKLRVVICEESSEVLLAHTLCTLFNSVEHAIFVGDPLQLRPHINTMALSMEHRRGERYSLDESLMERMMFGLNPLPSSKLTVQRRMHPDIADLSRAGDYPYIVDHESTKLHPLVTGMVDRLYWLDHRQPEDQPDPRSPMARSHSNRYEVEFCAGLVHYLVECGGYEYGEIAILTPYNGQLAALASRLRVACSIWLSDKDRESLIDQGLLPDVDPIGQCKTTVDLSSMLRIVTVDNFQGEEAKVIIFSAVRSNDRGKVGFLKIRNRINVAVSRARDGFYVVGDASLMSKIDHWSSILSVFKRKGMIGKTLKVCCTRHPDHKFEIGDPEQFQRIPTCARVCSVLLACGHTCSER